MDFVPLASRRKHEDIAEQIREFVIARKLLAGVRLPAERVLAKQFNVSRPSVRGALLQLQTQGFLTVKRGRSGGAYLREMDAGRLIESFSDLLRLGQVSITQLMDARLVIETGLLAYIDLKSSSDTLQLLKSNVDDALLLSRKAKTDSSARIQLLSNLHEFHILLATATGNQVFIFSSATVMNILRRHLNDVGQHSCVSLESAKEHARILEALLEGRVAEAQRDLETHIRNDSRRTHQLLKRRRSKTAAGTAPSE